MVARTTNVNDQPFYLSTNNLRPSQFNQIMKKNTTAFIALILFDLALDLLYIRKAQRNEKWNRGLKMQEGKNFYTQVQHNVFSTTIR